MTETKTSLSHRANPRSASALDREIGARVKLARQMAKLSQSDLANSVGVTFQQIQKYERGSNRVPASRLFEFAQVLDRPLAFFFEGVDTAAQPGKSEKADLAGYDHLNAETADRLLRTLDRLEPAARKKLVERILGAGK